MYGFSYNSRRRASNKYDNAIKGTFDTAYRTEVSERVRDYNNVVRGDSKKKKTLIKTALGEYIFNTNITVSSIKKVLETLSTSSGKDVSKQVIRYDIVELGSNTNKKAAKLRYQGEIIKLMQNALDACQVRVERADNLHFIRSYLNIAAIVKAASEGVLPVATLITLSFETSAIQISEYLAKPTHEGLKNFPESTQELLKFVTDPNVEGALSSIREKISYVDTDGKMMQYLTTTMKMSQTTAEKYMVFYPCEITPPTKTCDRTRKNMVQFATSFLRYYLEYIQKVVKLNQLFMNTISEYVKFLKSGNGSQAPQFTPPNSRNPWMARGGGAYDYVSNTEWMSPKDVVASNAISLAQNTPSNDPTNILPSASRSNMSNVDVLLGLDTPADRKAFKNHANTKAVSALLSSDTFIAKDLIEKRYKYQEQLDTLENNFYNTFNLQQLQDAVAAQTVTKQFQYKTENLTNTGSKDYESAKKQAKTIYTSQTSNTNTSLSDVAHNKDSIIASLQSVRGWKYIDLTKHAIGSMNDIVILATELLTKDKLTDADLPSIEFMRNILRPYRTKVYKQQPKNANISSNTAKLNAALNAIIRPTGSTHSFKIKANSMVSEAYAPNATTFDTTPELSRLDVLKEINKIKTDPENLNHHQVQEFLILIIFHLFQTVTEWLKALAEATGNSNAKSAMQKSIETFKLIYKSGIKNYFGIEGSTAKYAIDKGNRKAKASISPTSETYRIIGGLKDLKHLDRLQPESYPIQLTGEANAIKIAKEQTIKNLAKILEAADPDLFIGGPIQEPTIMKESVSMISKFVKTEIKAKKANIKRIDIIINKMKTRVHKQDLRKMTRLLELTYRDIATERNAKMKKLQIDSALHSITTTYKSYKDSELNAIKSMLSFSKLYDEQYKELTANRRTKLNYIKEREKVVVELLYNQLRAKTYRNLATSLYKFLKNNSDLNPTNNDINYSKKLPEAFYTLLEQAFDRIDEAYNNQLSTQLSQATPNRPQPSAPPAEFINANTINDFFTNVDKKYLENINSIINTNAPNNVNVSNINREISNVNREFRNAIKRNRTGATPVVPPTAGTNKLNTRNKQTRNTRNTKTDVGLGTLNTNRLSKDKRQLIASERFWLDIRKRMKGKTVFVAYVEQKTVLKDEHGFFDILEAAIRGKIYNKFIIPGVYVDMKTLSQIYGSHYLMVSDTNRDKTNPDLWQVLPMNVITTMAKLSQDDLRLYIYLLFTSSANFNKRLSHIWPDTSVTKEKVLNYCRVISGYEGCPLLKSRYEIANMLSF